MKDMEHSRINAIEDEIRHLHQEVVRLKHEKADAELVVEMITQHSDTIAEELFGKIENALRENEKRFRLICETIPVPIFLTREADSSIIYANEAAGTMIGIPAKELVTHKTTDFFSASENFLLMEEVRRFGNVRNYEIRGKKADNASFWGELFIQALKFDNESCHLSVFYDLTDRRLAEEERRRLATAVEQAAETIIITDRKGNIEYVNPAFEKTIGYSREEIAGQNLRMLKNDMHPESFYKMIWNAITKGMVWNGHLINIKKDGEQREFETTISPIRNSSGSIINFVSVNRDVTQEVRMEHQLRQSQKMEAIGTLAGGIAHDFNNILSVILGFAELAIITADDPDKVRNYLDNILVSVNRARELTNQILTFSRQSEQRKKPLQISLIIKESLKLIRATMPATIEIRHHITADTDKVMADSSQIHQVIMNLCINAAHAMNEIGGILSVSLEKIMVSEHPGLTPGAYLKLTIRDTGHGIPPSVKDRIFEPFFTTKKPGEGTGMGLAVVHGIVRSHGGAVMCDSEVGKGTSFHVYLPRMEEPEKESEPEKDASNLRGRERILFADDEKAIAEAYESLLKRYGYDVVVTTNSLEALELIKSNPDSFDIVVTDNIMPHLTGAALIAEIRRLKPDLPCILCTGTKHATNQQAAVSSGINDYLTKPVNIRDLAGSIRRIFDSK